MGQFFLGKNKTGQPNISFRLLRTSATFQLASNVICATELSMVCIGIGVGDAVGAQKVKNHCGWWNIPFKNPYRNASRLSISLIFLSRARGWVFKVSYVYHYIHFCIFLSVCWFWDLLNMRNRFLWWFWIDVVCAIFSLKVIHRKVRAFWSWMICFLVLD